MKHALLGLLLLTLPFLSGCEKQVMHFVTTYSRDQVFEVDQTGQFVATGTITKDDVRGALDIPDDAEITDVQIESLSLRIVKHPDNAAMALSVSGEFDNGVRHQLWNNKPVVLSGADVPLFGLNSLIAEGVASLRGQIQAYIQDLNAPTASFRLQGTCTPTASRMHLQIHLQVRATIKYIECVSVPRVMFDGNSCPDGPA
jgi:hypothetical protein